MVRSCGSVVLAVVVVAVGLVPRADARNPQSIKLGMLQGMFKDVPEPVVQAVAKPFADLFRKQTGLVGDVEVVADCRVLAEKMQSKSLHVGVFHGFEFAWVRDQYPQIEPLAVTIPPGRKVQACLVVNKDSPAASPGDLKGECVALPLFTKAHCELFLDRLQCELPGGCCCRAKHGPMTPQDTLDAVADGRLASALVDVSSLNMYQKNRPGLFPQLRVLCRSEPFPPAVIAFRTGTVDPTAVAKIREGLTKVNGTPEGRALMMLWNLQGFEVVPADFDAQMRRIAKAYPPPAEKAAMP